MYNIEEIQHQVEAVLNFSQGQNDLDATELLRTWQKNKKRFIDAMGGNLIYEYPIELTFELDEDTANRKFHDFQASVYDTQIEDFLQANKEGFFKNVVVEDYMIEGKKKIPKGMKLVKALKYFGLEEYRLQDLQNYASRVIQENCIKGHLCFSVHPLDYLSSSENTYNWRSCHALDGEYRGGNLTYMSDGATIVCYLKGADDAILPRFGDLRWNSKKWRMLMFLSDDNDMVALGREYPFSASALRDKAYRLFFSIFGLEESHFSPLSDEKVSWHACKNSYIGDHIPINGVLYPTDTIIHDCENALHYNDLLYSNFYDMLYSNKIQTAHCKPFHRQYKDLRPPQIHVGAPVKCLKCGQNFIHETASVMCDECELCYGYEENETVAVCEYCGRRFYREEGVFSRYDELLCPDCGDEYYQG